MDPRLAGLALTSGWVPVVIDIVALGLVVLVVILAIVGRPRRGLVIAVAGAIGVGTGLVTCWLVTDVMDVFGVSLSPISRVWVAAAFGGAGIALVALAGPGRFRRVMASLAIPAALVAGAVGVNADFGQYPTVGSLTGHPVAAPLTDAVLAVQAMGAPGNHARSSASSPRELWRTFTTAPTKTHGMVGTISIPAVVSHFPARPAYIYLPPVALVAHPIPLPVIVLLAGQPGGPGNMIESGRVGEMLDRFAASHHGLAPIVIIPDQLSAPQVNPMCVDSAIGNSATYLTVDVPNWIRDHLTVQTVASSWAIGGFSQGGTCSIQLAAAHPELFGAVIDICGELTPTNGDVQQTIDRGFGGKRSAYEAALPLHIIAAKEPYAASVAVVASGEFDAAYGPAARQLATALTAAGVRTSLVVSPGTAHDWHTVQWVLRTQLDPIYKQLGLEESN